MGWTIKIKSDRDITEKDIDGIVSILPTNLKGWAESMGAKIKQPWGWSVGVDIYNPKGKELTLHGSFSMSGNIAEESAKFISSELKKIGHKIRVGKIK